MSAEVLREAARLMRERAGAMPASPWGTVEGTMGKLGEVVIVYGAKPDGVDSHPQIVTDWGMERGPAAEWVASWHPAVALAVADWLDSVAAIHDLPLTIANASSDGVDALHVAAIVRNAVAVARAYLGVTS